MDWTYVSEQSQLDAIIPRLMQRPAWGFDTETTGLDPLVSDVTLMQFGCLEEQFLIDTRKVNPEPLRPVLESREIIKVAHNAKFDYKMVKANFGIEMERMRDTMLGAKILDVGRKFKGFSLDKVMEERIEVSLDKTMQKSFIGHTGDFSHEQLNYAALDVKYLLKLNGTLAALLKNDGLAPTYILESEVAACFGDMELEGLLLNKEGWWAIIEEHREAAKALAAKMDAFSEAYYRTDIFGNVEVNYGSPDQMLDLLKNMGVCIVQEDPKTKKKVKIPLTNTNADTLKQIKDVPFVQMLKQWRKHTKIVTTYGQPFIDAIHPATGRIHPEFDQLGTETGRPASDRRSPVNMLNIPRDRRMRNCFIAPEDFVIETDDYSGCELRILAHLSQDPGLMGPLLSGDDLHCSVASALYGVEVTKKNENAKLRTPAKSLNFGIAYGMGPRKLWVDLNAEGFPVTLQEARGLYNKYCTTYKDGVGYLRNIGAMVVASARNPVKYPPNEYFPVAINPNGRRRYWLLPDPNDREKFPNGEKDGRYLGVLAAIEREAGNFPIQATNADITKQGMIDIRRYIKDNKVRSSIILQVYDEIVTKTHKDDSPDFHEAKVKIMIAAAEKWINSVPIEVEGEALPYWTK